jgi:hypothetical protein
MFLHAFQAPVSLAGALEEYLNDPNFEQNRIEYKTNKEAIERGIKVGGNPTSEIKKEKEIKKGLFHDHYMTRFSQPSFLKRFIINNRYSCLLVTGTR